MKNTIKDFISSILIFTIGLACIPEALSKGFAFIIFCAFILTIPTMLLTAICRYFWPKRFSYDKSEAHFSKAVESSKQVAELLPPSFKDFMARIIFFGSAFSLIFASGTDWNWSEIDWTLAMFIAVGMTVVSYFVDRIRNAVF